MSIRKCDEKGLTLIDLRDFVDSCKDLPDSTPVMIYNIDCNEETKVVDMIGDNESIIFYDF